MKEYRLYQVDSFTRESFHGNPAGVVPNADCLTEAQMQRIARELNNSETAFIFASTSPEHDVRVRFFTPSTEVSLCRHATIAAHYVRAIEGTATRGCVRQLTGAGILPVEILPEGDDFSIVMTQGRPEVGEPLEARIVARIADALGLQQGELRGDCPVAIASAGHSKIMVGIKSLEKLHALKPDMTKLSALSALIGCNGYYIFTFEPDADVLVHGRMFAPAIGINEDPVTGNANGPLGAYLVHYGICKQLQESSAFSFFIRQGEAMGRDGGMQVRVEITEQRPTKVQIIGEAVVAFKTTITI